MIPKRTIKHSLRDIDNKPVVTIYRKGAEVVERKKRPELSFIAGGSFSWKGHKIEVMESKNHYAFAEDYPVSGVWYPELNRERVAHNVSRFTGKKVVQNTIKVKIDGKEIEAKVEMIDLTPEENTTEVFNVLLAVLPNKEKIPITIWGPDGKKLPIKKGLRGTIASALLRKSKKAK